MVNQVSKLEDIVDRLTDDQPPRRPAIIKTVKELAERHLGKHEEFQSQEKRRRFSSPNPLF